MSKQSICTIWCQYFRSSSFKWLTNLVSITTIIVPLAQGKGIRQIEEFIENHIQLENVLLK